MGKENGIGNLFMTFLLIIVALALTSTVQSSVTGVTGAGTGNLTGASLTLALLIPLAWVIMVLGIGFAAVYAQFKKMR